MADETDKQYARAEQARQRAIGNRDLGAYVNACRVLGVNPEIEIYEALESGLSPGEEARLRKDLGKVERRIRSRKKYAALFAYHEEHNVNLEQPEEKDVTWMRRGLINVLGYTKLKGVGCEKVLTRDAKPARIIETYRSCIIRAQR